MQQPTAPVWLASRDLRHRRASSSVTSAAPTRHRSRRAPFWSTLLRFPGMTDSWRIAGSCLHALRAARLSGRGCRAPLSRRSHRAASVLPRCRSARHHHLHSLLVQTWAAAPALLLTRCPLPAAAAATCLPTKQQPSTRCCCGAATRWCAPPLRAARAFATMCRCWKRSRRTPTPVRSTSSPQRQVWLGCLLLCHSWLEEDGLSCSDLLLPDQPQARLIP
jgi:hypothetical protein